MSRLAFNKTIVAHKVERSLTFGLTLDEALLLLFYMQFKSFFFPESRADTLCLLYAGSCHCKK